MSYKPQNTAPESNGGSSYRQVAYIIETKGGDNAVFFPDMKDATGFPMVNARPSSFKSKGDGKHVYGIACDSVTVAILDGARRRVVTWSQDKKTNKWRSIRHVYCVMFAADGKELVFRFTGGGEARATQWGACLSRHGKATKEMCHITSCVISPGLVIQTEGSDVVGMCATTGDVLDDVKAERCDVVLLPAVIVDADKMVSANKDYNARREGGGNGGNGGYSSARTEEDDGYYRSLEEQATQESGRRGR